MRGLPGGGRQADAGSILLVGLGVRVRLTRGQCFFPVQFWVLYPKFEVLGTPDSFLSNYFSQRISEFLTEGVNS